MRLALLALLCGCSGDKDSGDDSPTDDSGSTDGCEADPTDANANGEADACERELLASFETDISRLSEPTEHIAAWLAYDTDGALSTWVEFQPGIEVTYEEPGPVTVETSTLSGWDEVEARLVDEVDEPLATRVVAQDSGDTMLWPWDESFLGVFGELGGDEVHAVGLEVIHWDLSPGGEDMAIAWSFYGAPGVR